MSEGLPKAESGYAKRGEHLKVGVEPILACVGAPADYRDDPKIRNVSLDAAIPERVHSINIYGILNELKEQGFKSNGHESYVISPVDDFDKYSKDFYNCTGLIVAGKEEKTGRTISFLSHQNPDHFLTEENKENFARDLREQIEEIKKRCENGTIDAVLFGGIYAKVRELADSDPKSNLYIDEYLDSIKILAKEIKEGLGFEPTVLVGPKTSPGQDRIFYDNGKRRVYLIRDEIGEALDQNFLPSDIEERRKNWKPGKVSLPV